MDDLKVQFLHNPIYMYIILIKKYTETDDKYEFYGAFKYEHQAKSAAKCLEYKHEIELVSIVQTIDVTNQVLNR